MPRNQTNTSAFADALFAASNGATRRLLIIGDSQWSPDSSPRMLLGLRNRLQVPIFGWTCQANATISTILPLVSQVSNLANATAAPRQFDTSSPYTGTAMFAPGTLGISPTHWFERQFGGDYTASSPLWRGSWLMGVDAASTHFNSFRMGNWLRQNMNATGIYYHNGGAPSLTKFELIPYRNGSQVSGGVTVTPSGTGVFGRTITCNDSVGNAREPRLQFLKDASITEGVYDGTAVANSSLAILGAHLEQASPSEGVSVTPICNAGWSAEAHASTTMCSNTNLGGYLSAVGAPDMVLMMLGHNLTTNEVSGGVLQAQWKTNVSAIITRFNAQLAALGRSNIPWLLVTPWYAEASGGYADTIIDAQATAMHEIARDTASGLVGHVNLSYICGSGASLVSAGYLGAADIHPQSEAACNFFFDRLWDGIMASGAPRISRRKGGMR